LSTREIGQRLHISSKTVDTHRLNIKDKLNLKTLPELMRYAVRWGATQALI
jgi:DNA-binding CsgD family transcriptional regulator